MKKIGILTLALVLVLAVLTLSFTAVASAQNQGKSDGLNPAAVFDELWRQSGSNMAQIRLLTDNVESWYARWYVVSNAKKTLDITYFIVDKDAFGMSFLGLLLKKAREGVKIRLMVDARGVKDLSHKFMGQDYLQELVEMPNFEIHIYNPISQELLNLFADVRNVLASNHEKIIIADGEWVITGGRNIATDYFADARDISGVYRDTDLIMKGAAIAKQMKFAFDDEFNSHNTADVKKDMFNFSSKAKTLELARRAMESWINGMGLLDASAIGGDKNLDKFNEELAKYEHMKSYSSYKPFQGDREFPFFVLSKNSIRGRRNDITPGISAFMTNCEKEMLIQNPYVVLTEEAKNALKAADARGVKINIHTNSPASTDSGITQAFFTFEWLKIMQNYPNCRIFGFNGGRKHLHSKCFVFDRAVTVVGTYNMDPISQQINAENVIVIKSPEFSLRTQLRILEDEKESTEYKIERMKDGSVRPLVGPKEQATPEQLKKFERLHKLGFLRPII